MRLIIDTDTAGDDVFSILLALRHPGVTLEALTICNGNIGFDQMVENALIRWRWRAGEGLFRCMPAAASPCCASPWTRPMSSARTE
jgi:purine nucleosidase